MSNAFFAYKYYKPNRSQKSSYELIIKEYVGIFDHPRPVRKLVNINGKPTIDSIRYFIILNKSFLKVYYLGNSCCGFVCHNIIPGYCASSLHTVIISLAFV